jgi:hypothetical protein
VTGKLLQSRHQVPRVEVEGFGQIEEIVYADITAPLLDVADIRTLKTGEVGEGLLGQAKFLPAITNTPTESFLPWSALASRPGHSPSETDCVVDGDVIGVAFANA